MHRIMIELCSTEYLNVEVIPLDLMIRELPIYQNVDLCFQQPFQANPGYNRGTGFSPRKTPTVQPHEYHTVRTPFFCLDVLALISGSSHVIWCRFTRHGKRVDQVPEEGDSLPKRQNEAFCLVQRISGEGVQACAI